LFKNNFYVVVSNLVVFTSLKGVVEVGFIIPYYILRDDEEKSPSLGYFHYQHVRAMFNLSIFADYGVLFFSVLIAANRHATIVTLVDSRDEKLLTITLCALTWFCAAVIPLLFYFCSCEYLYNKKARAHFSGKKYTSEIIFYLKKVISRIVIMDFLKMLQISILCVLFLELDFGMKSNILFEIAYAENLLNLSIAAVYPICFLAMSGEMRRLYLYLLIFVNILNETHNLFQLIRMDCLLSAVGGSSTGLLAPRDPARYLALLVVESSAGLLVVLSNMLVMATLAYGWKRLMKNNFYVVVSNLVVFTSLKGVVEVGFIIPYYILRDDGDEVLGYFTWQYTTIMFNLSVFADYGVLLFTVLISVNRYMSIARFNVSGVLHRLWTAASCLLTWFCSSAIPVFYYICSCQFEYDDTVSLRLYHNRCEVDSPELGILLNCLIYLTYACTAAVLVVYLLIFM
ncbi:hypothetical protein PFISCL1PPCAC_12667, partial [Pristionchus fissidentatus]